MRDVARLHQFPAPKSPDAASRAVQAIRQGIKTLARQPEIGRPLEDCPAEIREWVIEFGPGANMARYHFDGKRVLILAVRYGREAGF
jgi:plasmid stabilization system protein ParE